MSTATLPDLETIEDLDFAFEPPCEHQDHDSDEVHTGPGAVVVDVAGCKCRSVRRRVYCASYWDWVTDNSEHRVYCDGCRTVWEPALTAFTFIMRVSA